MRAFWHRHSLSIVMFGLGIVCYAVGIGGYFVAKEWLETRDFIRNLGHGFFPLGVYNLCAGKLRELNKPEE